VSLTRNRRTKYGREISENKEEEEAITAVSTPAIAEVMRLEQEERLKQQLRPHIDRRSTEQRSAEQQYDKERQYSRGLLVGRANQTPQEEKKDDWEYISELSVQRAQLDQGVCVCRTHQQVNSSLSVGQRFTYHELRRSIMINSYCSYQRIGKNISDHRNQS
jgi:hypothetical protein